MLYNNLTRFQPRTEEDRLQFKEDLKKYKENKEKLRKQKEVIMKQTKKHVDVTVHKTQKHAKKHKVTVKTKLKEISDNSEASKKIKETFRSNMAGVMVSILNAYRKPECKEGRITNTEDFKHLARKVNESHHYYVFLFRSLLTSLLFAVNSFRNAEGIETLPKNRGTYLYRKC